MTTKISSQRHRDEEIIETKRSASDYVVMLGKEIEIDGEVYQIIIDGHHSYEAAMLDGVNPVYVEATATDCDRELIEDLDDYLEAHWVDSPYYNIETGVEIW